jgi:proteasome assembly chaperone (PAC2) family protein
MEGDHDDLVLYGQTQLRAPRLIAAFAGWPDAGEVATGSLRYLRAKLDAQRLGHIEADRYYDFTTARPVTAIEQGAVQAIRYPASDLFYWLDPAGAHDLILLIASEPQLRWRQYIATVLAFARKTGVELVITVGGLFDAVPHTLETIVSGLATSGGLRDELRAMGVSLTEYEGPSSIHTAFLMACQEAGLPSASVWGHAPNYVRATANPKVSHGLLTRICRLAGLDLNLDDLRVAGDYLDAQLRGLLDQNEELRLYVARLEEHYKERGAGMGDGEAADSILRDVEEYLRRRQMRGEEDI